MATTTIEAELLDLEKRYWQALKDQDVDAAMRLTDEPCIVTGAQGIGLIDRKTLAAMMKATAYTADSSTWVRRNGRWLCALHTEAIAGDPFGRDRQRIT
jgi:hypothetical protein